MTSTARPSKSTRISRDEIGAAEENSIARHLRTKRISQRTFARRIGVSQPTVNDWANGTKRPEGENVHKIAAAIGVDASAILVEFHLDRAAQ